MTQTWMSRCTTATHWQAVQLLSKPPDTTVKNTRLLLKILRFYMHRRYIKWHQESISHRISVESSNISVTWLTWTKVIKQSRSDQKIDARDGKYQAHTLISSPSNKHVTDSWAGKVIRTWARQHDITIHFSNFWQIETSSRWGRTEMNMSKSK